MFGIHGGETELVGKASLSTFDAAEQPSVIALAGRRVDAPHARQVRFPPENAPVVAGRIRECFQKGGSHAGLFGGLWVGLAGTRGCE